MKTAAAPEEEMTLHPCPVLFGLPIYCDDDGDLDYDDVDHDDKNEMTLLYFPLDRQSPHHHQTTDTL